VSAAAPNRASLGATIGLSQVRFFSYVYAALADNLTGVGEHYAGNWACCGQLSFLFMHGNELSGGIPCILLARRCNRRCFSSQFDAPSTDLDKLERIHEQ